MRRIEVMPPEDVEVSYEVLAERADAPRISSVLMDVAAKLEKPDPWLPTGLGPLDRLLDGGLRAGEVFVLASRPSVGKSSLVLQILLSVLRAGVSAALWSLEMGREQWARRALAALSGVPLRAIRTGTLNDEQNRRVVVAIGELDKMRLRFASTIDTTPYWFHFAANDIVKIHGAKLLVIDYLQLMQPAPGAFSRENEVAAASRQIKQTALELETSIIVCAQLNRNAEGKVPSLADLRESGAVEQDADEVFFLHREKNTSTNTLTAQGLGILAKNRDGETGGFSLRFDPVRFRFNAMDGSEPSSSDYGRRYEP